MEWIDRLAEGLGVEPLTEPETTRLLATAREVAHRVERKITPLAAFQLGVAVGRSEAGGAGRETAFTRALEMLIHRLPEATADEPP